MKTIGFMLLLVLLSVPCFGEVKRIVSLAPSVTELLFFIGVGDRIVGVTHYCNYPPAALEIPKIGDLQTPDIEKIANLSPDLIVASYSGNTKDKIERLESLGFRVLTLKENTVLDIIGNIDVLGMALGVEILPYKRTLWKKYYSIFPNTLAPKSAMILLSFKPFFSVSTNTFLGDVLTIAGFSNCVASTVAYPQISSEEFLRLKPEILFLPMALKNEEIWLISVCRELRLFPRLIYADTDILSRPSPRIFDMILEWNRYR